MKYILAFVTALLLASCSAKNSAEEKSSDTVVVEAVKDKTEVVEATQKMTDSAFLSTIYPYPSEGQKLLEFKKADLNADGSEDYLVLWEGSGEEECDCAQHGIDGCTNCCDARYLEVLLHSDSLPSGDAFYSAVGNSNLLYRKCSNPDRDPLQSIEAGAGYFVVKQEVGGIDRMNRLLRFQYDPNLRNWKLVEDASYYFGAANHERPASKFLKEKDLGSVPLDSFNVLK